MARKIVILTLAFAAILIAAFTAPRFVSEDQGLAAAATAALIFFVLMGVAHLAAIYLFVVVLRKRQVISMGIFLTGLLPLPIAVVCDAAFWMYVVSH